MERTTERDLHDSRAVPAHLEHDRFEACDRQRRRQPFWCSARMNDDIGFRLRLLRSSKAATERRCDTLAGRIDVDQLDFGTR